jgi:hypothetical protein
MPAVTSGVDGRIVPGRALRVLYALAAFGALPGSCAGSGWVRMAIGPGLLGSLLGLALVAWLVWRGFRVWRNPEALSRPAGSTLAAILCGLGSAAMVIGVAAVAGLFLVRPLTLLIFGEIRSDSGIEFFVVGVYTAMVASAAWMGVLLYEGGRAVARAPARVRGALGGGLLFAAVAVPALAWIARDRADHAYVAWARSCPEPTAAATFGTSPVDRIAVALQVDVRGADDGRSFGPAVDRLVAHPAVEFVESCVGTSCQRYERDEQGRTAFKTVERSSPLEWTVAKEVVSRGWGTRVLEVQHAIRTSGSAKPLATATESVFDWGPWRRWRETLARPRYEGCGYALREPSPYRSGVLPETTSERAYLRADLDLLASVLPEPTRFRLMAPIPGFEAPAESPPAAEPETPTAAPAERPDSASTAAAVPEATETAAEHAASGEPAPPAARELPPGDAGLQQALALGLIRRAGLEDFAVWRAADPAQTARALEHAEMMVRFDRAFVILAAFQFPAGLHGARAAVFLLPRGVPAPFGHPGHSAVYDVVHGTCAGAACGSW